MKKTGYSIFFFCIIFVCVSSSIPVFQVNLDLPPQERFKDLIIKMKPELQELQKTLINEFHIPNFVFSLIGYFAETTFQNTDFIEEIKGIAKYSGLPFGEVLTMNFMYEIGAGCTSIISIDEDGNILHGRNLDYKYKDQLKSLATRFEFFKNGKKIFEGDGNAGYLGLVTGMKKDVFTVSINERSTKNMLITIYDMFIGQNPPVPYFMRKILEKAESFDEAVASFKNQDFAAECYLIVSGTKINEGVVITRDRKGVYDIAQIDVSKPDLWFLVQTNYDRDVPDPKSDYRRVPAENKMKTIGRKNIDYEQLWDIVLTQKPNFRPSTISSAILSAQSGVYNTTVWN